MLAGSLITRLMVLAFGLALTASAGAQQRQVLIVAEDGGGNAARPILSGVETQLNTAAAALYVEAFDASGFPDIEAETPTASYLRSKYSGRDIDALVAVGPQALTFLARNGAELFPGVPTVFAGVSEASVARANLPNSTGVISAFGVTETADLALRLQPEAKKLVVSTGTSALDTIWYGTAREQLGGLSGRIEVSHLAGLPLEDVLVEVASLPRDTIVLFLSMVQDGSGRYFTPTADVVRDVAAVSGAPVYAVYDTLFGTGVIGGAMASFQDTGAKVGAMVLRILDGEAAAAIPAERQGNVYRTDWRQLQRFDLDASRLPPGTTVEFQPPPVWDQYRQEILAVLGILVFQTLLVVALLLRWRKRRVEHLLHESEDRYRNVVDAETDLICRYLPDTTLTFVNDAYCNYFGRTRAELIGTKLSGSLFDAEGNRAVEQERTALATPDVKGGVRRVVRADGSPGWLQWTAHPIPKNGTQLAEIQGIGRDITALRMAEREALERREQVTHLTRVAMLGELSGALAHELNQPLTAILSNAQAAERLLAQKTINVQDVRDILKDVVADDIRAGEVIRRLRNLLKPGHMALEPLRIGDVVHDVMSLARAQLVQHRVAVIEELEPTLPIIRGDRVQLQQVLLNVIINATDAVGGNRPDDRVVIAAATQKDGWLTISVRDNGTGLSSTASARLFEPFFTTKSNGLGLGLTICRSIVSAHGGRLSVRNNADRGATVEFTLPVAAA